MPEKIEKIEHFETEGDMERHFLGAERKIEETKRSVRENFSGTDKEWSSLIVFMEKKIKEGEELQEIKKSTTEEYNIDLNDFYLLYQALCLESITLPKEKETYTFKRK